MRYTNLTDKLKFSADGERVEKFVRLWYDGKNEGGAQAVAIYESGEMYLETIHVLSKKNGVVRAIDISEHMGYSKPSVSWAVGLLK